MPASLHVSLPDELRAFVDLRTNGTRDYATPSEYVRQLIRADMELESQRQQLLDELMKSADDIKHGRLYSAEEVEAYSKKYLDELADEDD
jgi:antitoxin ParD1/3/4